MDTFEQLGLIPPLRRALEELDFTHPTPIQAKAIPATLEGRDILGCAQTGTGKTAAFAIPILQKIAAARSPRVAGKPSALVLAPTRELAVQIDESFAKLGKRLKLQRALVYGGVNQSRQVRALRQGADILVATPGRLIDLMGQGHVDLSQLSTFVLDEVDRMLDMGFLPDLKRITARLPRQRQSLFYSATLPPKIRELANQLLTKAVFVNVTPKSPSVKKIEQRVVFMPAAGKQEALREIVGAEDAQRVLVFTNTKRIANRVAGLLERSGTNAAAIHGNKSQNARQAALAAFQQGHCKVLVATDVASRGIDVDGISHVVNYDLPNDPESYVHRIGRTGRAGAAGIAISLCSESDRSALLSIERVIGKSLGTSGQSSSGVAPKRSKAGTKRSVSRRYAKPTKKFAAAKKKRRSRSRNVQSAAS